MKYFTRLSEATTCPAPSDSVIALSGIRKVYPGLASAVLDDLWLDVRVGESVAVVGRSGAGKSTLLNILGLVDRPTAGTYRMGDVNVGRLSDRRLSRMRGERFGFIFQQFLLLERMTAIQNVAEPLLFSAHPPKREERESRAADLLYRVGLEDRMNFRPSTMSGGEQQRVAIARALVRAPRLVLADEPTGSLDPDTGDDVMSLFRAMLKEQGASLVLVTHSATVASSCDRILRLADGRLHQGAKEPAVRVGVQRCSDH